MDRPILLQRDHHRALVVRQRRASLPGIALSVFCGTIIRVTNQSQRVTMASVLVIDDEPAIRKVVASALATMGCSETYLAGDAESALEVIERKRPDLVISDV